MKLSGSVRSILRMLRKPEDTSGMMMQENPIYFETANKSGEVPAKKLSPTDHENEITPVSDSKNEEDVDVKPLPKHLPYYVNDPLNITGSKSRGNGQIFETQAEIHTEQKNGQSKLGVAIIKCQQCPFSREADGYIRSFFDKLVVSGRESKRVEVKLESWDYTELIHPVSRMAVQCAKIQVLIISHHLLRTLTRGSDENRLEQAPSSILDCALGTKNVIVILLAVSGQEIMEQYGDAFPRFSEWFSVDLRHVKISDPQFCKQFTDQVIRIYNLELSKHNHFSIFPKKVTKSQPRIAIIFREPINEWDDVQIELKTQLKCELFSDLRMANPFVLMFRVPDCISPTSEAIVNASVVINGSVIGTSQFKSELNREQADVLELDRMVANLPPFLDWFDDYLSVTLEKHFKNNSDFAVDPNLAIMNGIIICTSDILPTVMHYASYYGLPSTAFTILDKGNGTDLCKIRNAAGEYPSDMAFKRGHAQIGNMIRDYQPIANYRGTFSRRTPKASTVTCRPGTPFVIRRPIPVTSEESYDIPRSIAEEYAIPPADARPIENDNEASQSKPTVIERSDVRSSPVPLPRSRTASTTSSTNPQSSSSNDQ